MKRFIAALLVLACLSSAPAMAAPVPYPVVVTSTAGSRIAGATAAIGGTTLTAGTPTTVTLQNLATGVTFTAPVTYIDFGNGFYTFNYDALTYGEAYLPLVFTKAGSTLPSIIDLVCSADSPQIVSNGTASATTNTSLTALSNKIGTPAGATVSADIATANGGISGLTTAIATLPANTVAAMFGASYLTIPADHTLTGVQEVLTEKQWEASLQAVQHGDNVVTGTPAANSSVTVSYYLAGQDVAPSALVGTVTQNYGANGQQTTRVFKFAQPFPAVN